MLLLGGVERKIARIAERVGQTLGLLDRFGCTHVQGFGLGRPVPAEAILELGALHDAMRASTAAVGAPLGSTP